RPGWVVLSVGATNFGEVIARARVLSSTESNAVLSEMELTRSLAARLTGNLMGTIEATFLNGDNQEQTLTLELGLPRGELSTFGNVEATPVWYEAARREAGNGEALHVRFNYFLDLARVLGAYQASIAGCLNQATPCNGVVLDLRGNPGGIGA